MTNSSVPIKKTHAYQRIIQVVLIAAVAISAFLVLQRLLVPKYASTVLEGGMVREYYDAVKNHDVIFLGDCEAYTSYSPVTLWDEYGITSYIRGSPQQLVWHSYYLLEDTLRYETPKVVVFSVLAMQYGEPQSEPYNRLTLDDMPLSLTKINAIAASRTQGEDWLSYIFPFFRYKDRWRELSSEDFRYFFNQPRVTINGYSLRSDVLPSGFLPDPIRRADYSFSDKAYYYLERMVELSKENGITLILAKAPTLYPHWYKEWDDQIASFAQEHGISYINFIDFIDDIALDFSEDTFNAGISLNVYGAEKLTRYFADILCDQIDFMSDSNDAKSIEYWNDLSALYHTVILRQQEEISLTGKITSLLMN